MKKIVRLTENDLVHLVKRVMNEQLMNYAKPKENLGQTGSSGLNVIGKQVRFYKDEANTQPHFVGTIININRQGWGIEVRIDDERTTFECKDNYIKGNYNNYYNKNLINDLKKIYCTTSSGGTPVTNIGRYSSVDSNKPTNIA